MVKSEAFWLATAGYSDSGHIGHGGAAMRVIGAQGGFFNSFEVTGESRQASPVTKTCDRVRSMAKLVVETGRTHGSA